MRVQRRGIGMCDYYTSCPVEKGIEYAQNSVSTLFLSPAQLPIYCTQSERHAPIYSIPVFGCVRNSIALDMKLVIGVSFSTSGQTTGARFHGTIREALLRRRLRFWLRRHVLSPCSQTSSHTSACATNLPKWIDHILVGFFFVSCGNNMNPRP